MTSNAADSMDASPDLSSPEKGEAEIDLFLHEHASPEVVDAGRPDRQTALLVLSRDPAVIDNVRRAAPRGCVVADAFDVDMAADKMAKIRPGVLLADKDVVADVSGLVVQFTQHFPDLVVVAAGRREDSAALMQLTATGQIHRFLLLPLSHGQTRLALDAAVKRHLELTAAGNRAAATGGAGSGSKNYLPAYAGLAVAIVAVLAGIWWGIGRMMNTEAPAVAKPQVLMPALPVDAKADLLRKELLRAKQSFDQQHYVDPVEGSALEIYRGVLLSDPNNIDARQGLHDIADKMLERAEAALLAEHLEDAVSAIAQARSIQPDHPRLAFLDAQVARERERLLLSQAKDTVTKVRRLLSQAEIYVSEGKLTAPADKGVAAGKSAVQAAGDARDTLLEARRLDPTDPAVAEALRSLEDRIAEANLRAKLAMQTESPNDAASAATQAALTQPAHVISATGALQTRAAPASSPAAMASPAKSAGAAASAAQPPKSAAAATAASPPVAAISTDTPADDLVAISTLKRTRTVTPNYPEGARSKGIEGWVNVDFMVLPDGKVSNVKILDSTPPKVFDEAAVRAVRLWRFEPVIKNGTAVAQHTIVRLKFTM